MYKAKEYSPQYLILANFDFAFLKQAVTTTITTIPTTTIGTITTTTALTATGSIDKPVPLPRSISPSDSRKVYEKRNTVEQAAISPDSCTKYRSSKFSHKPQPKPRKYKPATNRENRQIRCSASPDSTSSAGCNIGIVSTCQNVFEKKLPVPHSPLVMEQVAMHNKQSTNVTEDFQSNTQ